MGIISTIFGAFSTVMSIVVWILTAICWYKVFEKANVKGWKAFIPFYEDYITYKLAGQSKWFTVSIIAWIAAQGLSLIGGFAVMGELMMALSNGSQMGQNGFLVFGTSFILSFIVFAINIYVSVKLVQRFGKSKGFGIGLVVLPIVFVPILAFGKAQYSDKEWI